MARPLCASVGIALLLLAPRAQAAIESDLVRQGIAAYDELDYAKSIDLLNKALAETLTKEEKVATYKTLAFAHVAVDKPDEAQKDFEQLLTVDPSFQMDRTVSPRVRVVFEKAQARIATTGLPSVDGTAGLRPEVTPRAPREGQTVSLRASYPGGMATKMVVFYRSRGQNKYNKIDVRPGPGSSAFQTSIPGMDVAAPALEYYVNMVDEGGAGVASAGSLGRPLALEVAPKPVYKRGAFWGGLVAGVVVVGAVAGILAATLPTHIGPDTPATLTIKPQ